MNQTTKEMLMCVILVAAIMLFFNIGGVRGHENGHAGRIKEFNRGDQTGWIEKAEYCWAGDKKQNKILLSIDNNRDDVVESCITLWFEHGRPHYVESEPDENGVCHCQGYIWLDNDSQGEEMFDYRDNWQDRGSE